MLHAGAANCGERSISFSPVCCAFASFPLARGLLQGRPRVHVSGLTRRRRTSAIACRASSSEPPARSGDGSLNRRSFCMAAAALVSLHVTGPLVRDAKAADAAQDPKTPPSGFITPSGVRFFDFVVGDGQRPKWGDFLHLEYTLYTITPNGDALVRADSTFDNDRFLIVHHGNGQTILGLEEALHSMHVGSRRRVIIPSSMGYVNGTLGPIPPWAQARKKFFKNLRDTGGTVVVDVEMTKIEPYDDKYGYYSTPAPSPSELSAIIKNAREQNGAPSE